MGNGPPMPCRKREGEGRRGGWAYNGMRITTQQQCETTLEHFTYDMADKGEAKVDWVPLLKR